MRPDSLCDLFDVVAERKGTGPASGSAQAHLLLAAGNPETLSATNRTFPPRGAAHEYRMTLSEYGPRGQGAGVRGRPLAPRLMNGNRTTTSRFWNWLRR